MDFFLLPLLLLAFNFSIFTDIFRTGIRKWSPSAAVKFLFGRMPSSLFSPPSPKQLLLISGRRVGSLVFFNWRAAVLIIPPPLRSSVKLRGRLR